MTYNDSDHGTPTEALFNEVAETTLRCELCGGPRPADEWVCPDCDKTLHTQMADDK